MIPNSEVGNSLWQIREGIIKIKTSKLVMYIINNVNIKTCVFTCTMSRNMNKCQCYLAYAVFR